ncbi:ribonuclease H-like protein [Phlegmacium glaucopus]|nr:ribonuclease H-like protein [Phlegmacium glaucopus]
MDHPNIKQRKFSFCPTLSAWDLNDLIVQCPNCTKFFAACCQHGGNIYKPEKRVCHQLQLVFTDGACSNNGQGNAKAGLGIVIGDGSLSRNITVDDTLDSARRTSQRAELLAAIAGLKMHEQVPSYMGGELNRSSSKVRRSAKEDYDATYIVVTDSEYIPKWQSREWRRADGKRPSNLDLFMELDRCTTTLEQKRIAVGFWHIPRTYNHRADKLAKEATRA